MHANYLLAKSRTVTPQAPADISMHMRAHIQKHAHCHCSSSTYLRKTGTFTIETSENLVDTLKGIPLTKATVKTVCRLMIDHIHYSVERAEHGTSYAVLLYICF